MWWMPCVRSTWSSYVNRLRTAVRLLPALVPAPVIWEAPFNAVPPPMTTAPIGAPSTQPGNVYGRLPREEVRRARKPSARCSARWARRRAFPAALATCSRRRFEHQAQRIGRRRVVLAVVNRVDAEESVLVREIVVQARGAEIFPDGLQGMAERFADAAAQARPVLRRP